MKNERLRMFRSFVVICSCVLFVTLIAVGALVASQRTGGAVFGENHAVMSAALSGEKLTVDVDGRETLTLSLETVKKLYDCIKYVLPVPVNAVCFALSYL